MSADNVPATAESPLRLGPFTVRATPEEAEAFARETGGKAGHLPFTFPVRWFARADLRTAAARLMGEAAWVPLHESQNFDYRRPLQADVDYHMRVDMWREAKPPRLILRAEIATVADELCLSMEMILRIVSMSGMEESAKAPQP
jgi:hypothetical protein